jgi:hypothetical protein
MSQQLFSAGKVGCFVDDYGPGQEKRRGETISTITVKLRVMPFDAKLAAALDSGVGNGSNIKSTIFSLNSGDPKPNFTRHDFKLSLARQNLQVYASTDTVDSRIALLQAKISGTYVRTQKDINALALCFKATFGPVGRDELELIHSLHRSQAFIRFQESEPLLEVEEDGDAPPTNGNGHAAAPMFETDADGKPIEAAPAKAKKDTVNRKLHSHQSKKAKKRR